jgi:release factor glutamine methyltransferase
MAAGGTVSELLARGRKTLESFEAGNLEAELLLCRGLNVNRAWIYAHGPDGVSSDLAETYAALLQRRQSGEPLAYITGEREFWSLALQVTPDVLIPRPETELLVETVLDVLPGYGPRRIVDLGTGSGAVALAIASERLEWEVHATDVSDTALGVAKANADRLLPGRVVFHQGSWLAPLEGKFHAIVANPPYIAEKDQHLDRGDCRYEPRIALTPGGDGLSAIQQIACDSVRYLAPGGCIAFEHGYDQGEQCRQILEQNGYTGIKTRKDIEGRDRVTLGFSRD